MSAPWARKTTTTSTSSPNTPSQNLVIRFTASLRAVSLRARKRSEAIPRRVAIVRMHPTNKPNPKSLGDPFDAISGSIGIQAPCDALILLERAQGGRTAKHRAAGVRERRARRAGQQLLSME